MNQNYTDGERTHDGQPHADAPVINVVGAAIMRNGKVLCAKRGPGKSLPGHWEFPGGKIEHGESARQALHREIEEELRCDVTVMDELCTSEYAYDFGTVRLTVFLCLLHDGAPRLTEHAEVRWLPPSALHTLDWAPADRPAVEALVARHSPESPGTAMPPGPQQSGARTGP